MPQKTKPTLKSKRSVPRGSVARTRASRKSADSGPQPSKGLFGYDESSSLLGGSKITKSVKYDGNGELAVLHIFGCGRSKTQAPMDASFVKSLPLEGWQKDWLGKRTDEVNVVQAKAGLVWITRPKANSSSSGYGLMRDRVGSLWPQMRDMRGVKEIYIQFHRMSDDEILGALVGLEIASYKFTSVVRFGHHRPSYSVSLVGVTDRQLHEALAVGRSMNIARHLVNLDAATLNPKSYAEAMTRWFRGKRGVTVEVWDPDRLRRERMNLHLGVGQGAPFGSHMVHIRYRPAKSVPKPHLTGPLAIVGKGVTFDSGGLDIKPPSGMRLMKKDMGGSATVVGIANYLTESQSEVPCDLYLALAENSVDAHSFRPGDVIKSRNGLTIEIHNTDAEGRLILADVIDVAQSKSEKPCAVIDFATLTGAMRVAVGTEIAGYFSTSAALTKAVEASAIESADPVWRLPLWDNYRSQLKSTFADMANASDSGFAGAITAALFLERFIKPGMPWLHFDLYCWNDRAQGALVEVGGNGQGIQMFRLLAKQLASKSLKL
jgi:leucyl aminopeptidase